jgi:hypothetical protein
MSTVLLALPISFQNLAQLVHHIWQCLIHMQCMSSACCCGRAHVLRARVHQLRIVHSFVVLCELLFVLLFGWGARKRCTPGKKL